MSVTLENQTQRYTGRVKWFNPKSGFGFITLTDGENAGEDIFCHHSDISVESEQFKYLVQGEYVTLGIKDLETDAHQHQAETVRGVNGGKLMCETNNEVRRERMERRRERQQNSEETGQQRRTNNITPRTVPTVIK